MTPGSQHAPVLVVDDDPQHCRALQELLQNAGQTVVVAHSGDEALRCALKEDFAVILLDAKMPGVDGFATAKMIRERPRSRHTPIIFLTGAYEDAHSVFRGYEAGAVDYIVKPLIPEVLRSKIAVFVELHNKNARLEREVAERQRAEGDLRTSQDNLRALAARLESVREEERTRIAREIHDQLGQILTALKMDLTWIAARFSPAQRSLARKAKSMCALIDETIRSVRELVSRLRPEVLDELGLAAAIAWQAKDFQMRTGIRCRVTVPPEGIQLDPDRSTAAFRVFQELLTNAARHANATKVEVTMRVEAGVLALMVADNGRGIADADIYSRKSLGLLGMRERVLPFAGNISIVGTQGKGTSVTVSIPLGNQSEW